MEESLRPAVVDDDLDKLYYADEPDEPPLPRKRVPYGDVYEAARAGDVDRLKVLLEAGINVNARDDWDSVALYYACLAGHLDAAQLLLESGAICSEHTFDGDRCHYAALNLDIRRLLKSFEARPPPLKPLQEAFRLLFFRSGDNSRYADPTLGRGDDFSSSNSMELEEIVAPDIVFFVGGKPISAHRAVLAARCELFRRKFAGEWRCRSEVRFARNRLSFAALFSLIGFFYTDRLDIAVEDMEDLLKICATCGCKGLYALVSKELVHQKYAAYKSLQEIEESQKRFILQGSFLPEEQRLPASMARLLKRCLERSNHEAEGCLEEVELSEEMQEKLRIGSHVFTSSSINSSYEQEDYADLCFVVGDRRFRCHSCVVAARSEYVRARILRMNGFSEGKVEGAERILEEHDVSAAAFEKLLRYIYTDVVEEPDFDEAAEMLDAASRYLLFPLKRAVADAVLPRLENATPVELCQWLLLADMYGVWKIREYCLDSMALNFDVFAATPVFRAMLRKLPLPSGDSAARTSAPSAPGVVREGQENLLDDLREKWLEAEAAELDKRDESARHFDRQLELLIEAAGNDETESDLC